MPNQNFQYSPTLQNRYTNTQRSRHTRFDQGMMRDISSWELPEGACYDAADMLCDFVGKIRKRGGTTSPAAGNSAATVENLLSFRSNGLDGAKLLYGSLGKGGVNVNSIASATGASTNQWTDGSVNTYAARPFQHGNLAVFPFQALATSGNDRNSLVFAGGSTGTTFAVTAATVTANDNRITAVAPTSFVAAHVGSLIELDNLSVPGTHIYIGRIVEVTSSSAIRVEPAPILAFTATQGRVSPATSFNGAGGGALYNVVTQASMTGRYGVSFQNRLVLGYTLSCPSNSFATGIEPKSNRIAWQQLPTEAFPASAALPDGDITLWPGTFLPYNYVDIPNLGGMTGLAVVGDGQVVAFGPRSMFRLSGQLVTETVANNAFSFSVDQISNNVGIPAAKTPGIDDPSKSIQYAQGGVIFAGSGNLYLYDGSSLKPLLSGRNSLYYQNRLRTGDVIYGSAYSLPLNHYYLSMSGNDGGLLIDLNGSDGPAMTRMTNMQFFDAVPDPANASTLWGARWWDRTGAAPTMTKGQLIQIDPIWAPTSANKNDGDGTAVLGLFKSAAYVNGALASNKMTADLNLTADLRGSGSPTATVKADTKLNVSDASFTTLGTFPSGTAAVSKSFPVGYLVAEGPAIEIQIGNDVACDSFELLGLDFGTQGRPEEFST